MENIKVSVQLESRAIMTKSQIRNLGVLIGATLLQKMMCEGADLTSILVVSSGYFR